MEEAALTEEDRTPSFPPEGAIRAAAFGPLEGPRKDERSCAGAPRAKHDHLAHVVDTF